MSIECKGILNPLTGVCVEKTGASQTTPQSKTVILDDYQLGGYCKFMKKFNENPILTEMAYAYDSVFEAVEKVDSHTLKHLANAATLESTFPLATAGAYAWTISKTLKNRESGLLRALTTDAYGYGRATVSGKPMWGIGTKGAYFHPFKMALMAQLMLSGYFSSPDMIMDEVGGKELTGKKRAAAYWGIWGMETGAALWMFGNEYSSTFNGQKISKLAKRFWVGGWAGYSGYMYGRTDQREFYRLQGMDPKLGNDLREWTWDGYNPNRYSSDWAAGFIGGAAFWGLGPKVGRMVADKVYAKMGYPDYFNTGLKFSEAEKSRLFTEANRSFLAQSTFKLDMEGLRVGRLLKRAWIGIGWVGRLFKNAGLKRYGYALTQMLGTTLVASIPLSRIAQKARGITEDDRTLSQKRKEQTCLTGSSATLHGVSNRTLLSATANAILFAPLRWAGMDPSIFLYYAPGMASNVYPANSCNEYRGVPNQMALVHLERYRQATTPEKKAHEQALFQFNFSLANPEDQEKTIKRFSRSGYPQEIRELFEPFLAGTPDLTPEKVAEIFTPLSMEDVVEETLGYKKEITRIDNRG